VTTPASIPPPRPLLSAAPPPIEPEVAPVRVAIVDDEAALRRSLSRVLRARGFEVSEAEDGEAGIAHLMDQVPDVALVDMMMPKLGGLDVLVRLKEMGSPTQIILMTAFADVESAVSAMKGGAYHFLTKPFHSNDAVVQKAAEHRRLLDRTRQLEERLLSKERFGEIVGSSPRMAQVYRLIEGVAPATSTILILGESGTGKELVARAIHQRSQRANKPFLAINCGAIPKDLVESELFGHLRGAFSGAQTSRAGLFESAHGGTVFLDEIGDLPLPAQVKLLRTLQEGEVKRVGSDETRTVDVRVLAATNVDLASKIEAGIFRRDLFYRLNVIAIALPALRERAEDIPLLAQHFLQKYALRMNKPVKSLSEGALRALQDYSWPGNVRELEHAIERAVVLAQGEVIAAGDVLPGVGEKAPAATAPAGDMAIDDLSELPYPEAKRRMIERFDDAYTSRLLSRTGGNLSEAARLAGLDRSNFRRILKRHK
jgi:DNA-binding NtrC family response regulator